MFFAWKDMLLPGLLLSLWFVSVARFMRHRTGLDDKEDVLARRKLVTEERERIEEKKKELDPSTKTKLRLGVRLL